MLPRDDEHPGLYGGTRGGDAHAQQTDPAQERLARAAQKYAPGQRVNDTAPVWG